MSANRDSLAELVREFGDAAADVLAAQLGLPPAKGAEIGYKIAMRVCQARAGEQLYIPTGYAQEISERDVQIHAAMVAKEPVAVIARRFGLTIKQTYERHRLYCIAEVERTQARLFQDPD